MVRAGGGLSGAFDAVTPIVNAMAVVQRRSDRTGHFTTAGGVSVNRIARWKASAWSALGGD